MARTRAAVAQRRQAWSQTMDGGAMSKFINRTRGLSWVRLETSFAQNHKVLDLAARRKWRAVTVYICGLGYSGAQGLDGFIPKSALPMIHGTRNESQTLVDAGMWEPVDGGWDIHDWDAYQPTAEESNRRKAKAKSAAEARWKRERAHGLLRIEGEAMP